MSRQPRAYRLDDPNVTAGAVQVTEEPFDYHNWANGGPNDYFGEDGLQFWGDSARWNDIDRVAGYEAFVKGFVVEYGRGGEVAR